jgi:hypothetical protein
MVVAAIAMAIIVVVIGGALPRADERPGPPVPGVGRPGIGTDGCLAAPVSSTVGITGTGQVCDDDHVLRAAFHLRGLTAGESYTAWLEYRAQLPCSESPCEPGGLMTQYPSGQLARLGDGVATSTSALELRGELSEVHLVSGMHVSLLLTSSGERAGEQASTRAQVSFLVP